MEKFEAAHKSPKRNNKVSYCDDVHSKSVLGLSQ